MPKKEHSFEPSTYDERNAEALLADDGFKMALRTAFALLGTAFVVSPKDPAFDDAIGALASMDLAADWPFGDVGAKGEADALLARGQTEESTEDLVCAYTRLFRGPGHLPAPPWGSVYMDRDQVMYGWTWVELRAWMRANGFAALYQENDPEDHFGRLLLLGGEVLDARPCLLCEFLGDHVLCWSDHFLEQFTDCAESPTYTGLAILARTTLADVQDLLSITPSPRAFFR